MDQEICEDPSNQQNDNNFLLRETFQNKLQNHLQGSVTQVTFIYIHIHSTKLTGPSKGLVTNYGEGGATKREGGAREVLPLRKGGGGGKSFSHAEGGGGTNSFGVVFRQ